MTKTADPVAVGAEAIDDLLVMLGVDPQACPEHGGQSTAETLAAAVLNATAHLTRPPLTDEEQKTIRRLRGQLKKITPYPWLRPLNTRWKCSVTGVMPKGDPASRLIDNTDRDGNPERVTIVSAPIWSMGGFVRKGSGKDLDFIAGAPENLEFLMDALERRVTGDRTL